MNTKNLEKQINHLTRIRRFAQSKTQKDRLAAVILELSVMVQEELKAENHEECQRCGAETPDYELRDDLCDICWHDMNTSWNDVLSNKISK